MYKMYYKKLKYSIEKIKKSNNFFEGKVHNF